MEIILFRHGKAETYSDAKPDFDRELTSLGQKKMKQAARGLAGCLFPEGNIIIWTSPLVRAKQTAQILKTAFGKRATLLVVDAAATGTLEEIASEWAGLPEESTLIVVGHEPMISDWTKALCGAHISFRPASAASIAFDGENRRSGQLFWFMRVGVMARLGLSASTKRRQRT